MEKPELGNDKLRIIEIIQQTKVVEDWRILDPKKAVLIELCSRQCFLIPVFEKLIRILETDLPCYTMAVEPVDGGEHMYAYHVEFRKNDSVSSSREAELLHLLRNLFSPLKEVLTTENNSGLFYLWIKLPDGTYFYPEEAAQLNIA
jgi:hypothetical protein